MSTNTNVVVIAQDRDPITIGFIPVMLFCAFVALAITYFWQILTVAILFGFGVMLWRAELQQRFAEGDPHGIYGDFDEGSQR